MDKWKQYDIIIIGAGPAGSMLARLIGGAKRVAIIDARPLDRPYKPGDRLKSCGGLIAPTAQKFLNDHDIRIPDNIRDHDQYDHVITTDFDINVTRRYKRNYINVDREGFDRFLLSGISADTYFNTVVNQIGKRGDLFIINDKWAAPILVGADGATSIVRRRLFPHANFREYVSIQETFFPKRAPGYECFFERGMGDYYGWTFNKNDKTYLGYLIPAGPDALDKFRDFKIRRGYGMNDTREGAVLIRPHFRHPVTHAENVFLIGEAGGYISPSSAEGISYALRTAEILYKSGFDTKMFRRRMRKIQREIFIKNIKSWAMHTPWPRHLIMRLSRDR